MPGLEYTKDAVLLPPIGSVPMPYEYIYRGTIASMHRKILECLSKSSTNCAMGPDEAKAHLTKVVDHYKTLKDKITELQTPDRYERHAHLMMLLIATFVTHWNLTQGGCEANKHLSSTCRGSFPLRWPVSEQRREMCYSWTVTCSFCTPALVGISQPIYSLLQRHGDIWQCAYAVSCRRGYTRPPSSRIPP